MGLRLRLAIVAVGLVLATASGAWAQQRGSISGRVLDASGLALPGATVTVTDQNTGFARDVVTADTGAYTFSNLEPGTYTVTVELSGFASLKRPDVRLTAGSQTEIELKMQIAGVQEQIVVTGEAPLVERSSNKIGGTLSGGEIDAVPSNFRNFTALTQLVPGMTPNPAASSFEGGQVVANGTPSQGNVYLLDGMYNNDDRLGGSQGTQVRLVLDNIEEYQVLSNQYSAEYGGGAGAIINMITRGGSNKFSGRAYSYFRDEKFNNRNAFLPDSAPKPDELTRQMGFGIGGPILLNRAHFMYSFERDDERIAGQKRFPASAAPLARDFVGAFTVKATNQFARGDVQLSPSNIINVRWLLETAPTRGEGFNTNTETIDAQQWESDWDQLFSGTYTAVLSNRLSNVIRVGRIGEQLGTGAQTFFDDNVNFVGFDGRDPFTLGQRNVHPSYFTGKGGEGLNTRIRTYTFDESFTYFVPSLMGEHTFKGGVGISFNQSPPRAAVSSGTYQFRTDAAYDPNNPASYPFQFDITVGPPGVDSYAVFSKDRRNYFFVEDQWKVKPNVTLNMGLRYDHQRQTPASKDDFSPRAGLAWDISGQGRTVVRGGVGKFYSYVPISIDLAHQQTAVRTLYPNITITDVNSPILRPDVIADSLGNLGVAVLSPAGRAELTRLRDSLLAGSTFNRNPRLDSADRQLPYAISWSVGFNHQLTANSAIAADYVGNVSRDQVGIVDLNEPVNRVRPGVAAFDPGASLIPAEARGTNFQRVLQTQTRDEFGGKYNSLQVSFLRRMANKWSGRVAYTVQKSYYVGLGNPDNRRVWLDNEIDADYGRFASDRRHVLAMSGTVNPWKTLSIATVISAISGAPINETVGTDVNGDNDNTDRPVAGINDLTRPIESELDAQGRAVINGLSGPESLLVDVSFRYQVPLAKGFNSLDLFYDIFNITNRTNLVPPTGNRASANFMIATAAQFPRQMQFGVRVRF